MTSAAERRELRPAGFGHATSAIVGTGFMAAVHTDASAGRKNRLSLELDGASAAAHWLSEQCEELWVGRRDEPNELRLRAPGSDARQGVRSELPGGHTEGFADTFVRLYAEVYRVVLGEPRVEGAYPTFADGRRAVAVADAIGRCAREERWVQIAD